MRDNVVYWKTKRKINDDLRCLWMINRCQILGKHKPALRPRSQKTMMHLRGYLEWCLVQITAMPLLLPVHACTHVWKHTKIQTNTRHNFVKSRPWIMFDFWCLAEVKVKERRIKGMYQGNKSRQQICSSHYLPVPGREKGRHRQKYVFITQFNACVRHEMLPGKNIQISRKKARAAQGL